jgi:Holliday junction resolvase RusA-like endonuclease
MKIVSFEIPGYCQPKQRTFGNRFVTPPETRAYEKVVRQLAHIAMRGQRPFDGFLGVEIEIICEIPKSWSKKKRDWAIAGKLFPTHCDLDNQTKAICDGMNRTVYEDDRRINHLIVRREYGEPERVTVTVRSLGG